MEGDIYWYSLAEQIAISIHSLRMEGDDQLEDMDKNAPNFNPLPPYGGRRAGFSFACTICQFQSTPSVWRETYI